tara:strand:+ start:1414 stop:2931 length:1518 start_codon:yes stop_codon:yes gene_type:complete
MKSFDNRATIIVELEKLTNSFDEVKKNVHPKTDDPDREYLRGSEEEVGHLRRTLATIKTEIAKIKADVEDDIATFKTIETIYLKDGTAVKKADFSYKVFFKILVDYETKDEFQAEQTTGADTAVKAKIKKAADDFFSFVIDDYFLSNEFPPEQNDDAGNVLDIVEQWKRDLDRHDGVPKEDVFRENVEKFINNALNVFNPEGKNYTLDSFPDSVKLLFPDLFREITPEEKEAEIEAVQEEALQRLNKDEALYNHIKKMLEPDSTVGLDYTLLKEEDVPEFNVKFVKGKLKELKDTKASLKTQGPKDDLLNKYVEVYEAIKNAVSHHVPSAEPEAETKAINSATAVNAYVAKRLKYTSLHGQATGLTPELYKAFIYLFVSSRDKDNTELHNWFSDLPRGAADPKIITNLRIDFERAFGEDNEVFKNIEHLLSPAGNALLMKLVVASGHGGYTFEVENGITKQKAFITKLEFPTDKDEPAKEQIERSLHPIIEKILREEHGEKELYY